MPRALILSDGDFSSNDRSVGKLLDFFGVVWEVVTISQFAVNGSLSERLAGGEFHLFSSAPVMAAALQVFESRDSWQWLREMTSSAYIYGFAEADSCRQLVRSLTGDSNANIGRASSKPVAMSVSSSFPEMCGPMAGMQVQVTPSEADLVFDLHAQGEHCERVISTNDGDVFAKVIYEGLPFYLNACRDIIDIDTPARKPFDVKECFCNAVPITMYLKWAFGGVSWPSEETRACLIVDDPLLRPRYGFLRFSRALELMDEHNFTMSLAFIPWNQRRTNSKIVQLFKKRSDRFSLSIHGCDHTASEFAARSSAELNAKTKVASERMNSLSQRTSLAHDRIMIFPQGEFSAEAGRVLKLNGFVAAVNTEVTPSRGAGNETTVADLWDVAINKYGTFPIFTRRYFTHGIENFAFDILLGKPCLMVAHHDGFKDDGHDLIEFIDKLNSLPCKLVWGSLGDVIRRSDRVCYEPNGTSVSKIYSNHVLADNASTEPCPREFVKEESDPDCLGAVLVNGKRTEWNWEGGYLRFRTTIPPNDSVEARIVYVDKLDDGAYPAAVGYKVKTGLRRYLSETRDQYLSQSSVLNKSAAWMRQALK